MNKLLHRIFGHKDAIMVAVIVAAVFIANGLHLIGKYDANPLLTRAGIATQVTPGLTSGDYTIDPNDGFTSQALGHLAAEQWLQGHVPYWNHYEGLGSPLAGEMQSGALFPLVILLHFANGLLYMHMALELIAGIATYFFLRRLGIQRVAAVVGGVAFSVNGTFAWLTNAAFNPIAFLPVLLLGAECTLAATRERRRGGWILVALGLALSLYAGFPETAFVDALFAYGWAAIRLFELSSAEKKSYVSKLVLASVAGLLLAAPILIAFVSYLANAYTGGHAGAYANAALITIGLGGLITPYTYGPIFAFMSFSKDNSMLLWWGNVGGYLTGTVFALAIVGLFSSRRRALKIYLMLWILLCLGKVFGVSPVMHLLNLIPGMKYIAFYRYSPPSWEFAAIILAAFGLDALLRYQLRRRQLVYATAVFSVIAALLMLVAWGEVRLLRAAPHHRLYATVSAAWLFLSVGIIMVLAWVRKRAAILLASVLVMADALLMFMVPQVATPHVTAIDTSLVSYLKQHVGTGRFYTLGPLAPNYGSYYQIASVNVNDLPIPKNYADYVHTKLDSNVDPFVFTGTTLSDPQGLTPVQALTKNFENYRFAGVHYIVAQKGLLTEATQTQLGLKLAYSGTAGAVYAVSQPKPYFEVVEGSCSMSHPTITELTVNCVKPGTIIRREASMPGWKVEIDNRNVPISTYHHLFQEVNVPTGVHKVTYSYAPPHIGLGWLAFLVGILVCVLFSFSWNPKTYGRNITENFQKSKRGVAWYNRRYKE